MSYPPSWGFVSTTNERDDEPEIEVEVVEVVQTPPRRRPRAQNPAVDEVIQSGEIQPRSHIVRSSPSLPVFEFDEPTQVSIVPEFPREFPRRSRRRYLWLVAAILSAGGAFASTLVGGTATAMTAEATASFTTIAVMVGQALDADARAALLRAQALSASPMLRAGIETDPQTMADMVRDKDLVVMVDATEVVEVAQIRDGIRTVMLRIPATAEPIAQGEPRPARIEASGAGLKVIATAEIPKQRAGISGEVLVSTSVDLEQIKKRTSDVARQASLRGFASPVTLVALEGEVGPTVEIPIATKLTRTPVAFAAAAPVPTSTTPNLQLALRYGGLGLAGLFALIFILSMLRRDRGPAALQP